MRIPIPCHRKRFRLTLGFVVNRPCSLLIVGRDAEHPHSNYISRKLVISQQNFEKGKGYKTIQIPFPLAPEFMMLNIWDAHHIGRDHFQITTFKVEGMEDRAILEHQDIHDFIPFANWFSQNAGILPTAIYDSSDLQFVIDYKDVIKNEQGIPLLTPARTARSNGRIEASKSHLLPLSIPIRWFILMHERKHFQLPTRIEKVADLTALRVFLDYGFPKVEALYACTLAMQAETTLAKETKLQRLQDIHRYIDQYIATGQVIKTKVAA